MNDIPKKPVEWLEAEVQATALKVPQGTLWRHRNGATYIVMSHCMLEHSARPAVIYRALDQRGPAWARDVEEFLDGRFTEV